MRELISARPEEFSHPNLATHLFSFPSSHFPPSARYSVLRTQHFKLKSVQFPSAIFPMKLIQPALSSRYCRHIQKFQYYITSQSVESNFNLNFPPKRFVIYRNVPRFTGPALFLTNDDDIAFNQLFSFFLFLFFSLSLCFFFNF